MIVFNFVKIAKKLTYIVTGDGNTLVERCASVAASTSLVYLAQRAAARGDFHELNHIQLALRSGTSEHENNFCCGLPTDRGINGEELSHHLNLSKPNDIHIKTGLYL